MAHTCPDCGEVCYCNGDIDDMILDRTEKYIKCRHYLICNVDDYDEINFDENEEINE